MKILYQHRTLGDGAEGIHIREMVEAFRDLGHEVVVHALMGPQGPGGTALGRFKRLLPAVAFELCAIAYNIVEYWRFWRAVRREQPDIVYKRHALHDVAGILAARRLGIPTVLEMNAAYSSSAHQRLETVCFKRVARWCEWIAVNQADLVVAVSTPLKDLVKMFASDDQVIVLPNGANPKRFRYSRARSAAVRLRFGLGHSVVIGWAGILRKWHGLDLLLQAMTQVAGAKLLIIGDGPDRSRLEGIARELGIAERVVFTGRVSYGEMPDHIAAADVTVASDDHSGYASPMKLLEYMAMARPVVAPRLRNIEDFIEDGFDGVLFTPGSADDLARALNRLLREPERCHAMGECARAKVVRDRNWRRNAQLVLAGIRAVERKTAAAALPSEARPLTNAS